MIRPCEGRYLVGLKMSPWFEEVDGADLLDEIANLIMLQCAHDAGEGRHHGYLECLLLDAR